VVAALAPVSCPFRCSAQLCSPRLSSLVIFRAGSGLWAVPTSAGARVMPRAGRLGRGVWIRSSLPATRYAVPMSRRAGGAPDFRVSGTRTGVCSGWVARAEWTDGWEFFLLAVGFVVAGLRGGASGETHDGLTLRFWAGRRLCAGARVGRGRGGRLVQDGWEGWRGGCGGRMG
jgi:hypothetical protein